MSEYNGLKGIGTHGICNDGEIQHNIPDHSIYVNSETDLTNITDVPSGTLAIQYGFARLWQFKPDGSWIEI